MAKKGNGSGSFIWSTIYFGLQVTLILAVITFLPGLPPDVEFTYYKLNLEPPIVNKKLKNVEKLYVDEVKGPEDFAVYKNELFTGTHGGYVQKFSNGKLVPVMKFGKDCNGFHEEDKCGRPLGLRFDSKGILYVADAYYGVMKANITSGEVKVIASTNEPIDGLIPNIPNSVAVSQKTGDVFWTDSSTSHKLYDGLYTLLADGTGRLIKFNAAKGKNEVLLTGIHFANGLALSSDESFVVIAETFRTRLIKYYLKGPKAGQSEVFANLPGFPDNVNFSGGRFSVSLISTPDALLKTLPEYPLARKLISRVLTLIEMALSNIEALYPNDVIKRISHLIGHFETLTLNRQQEVSNYFFDENGKVLETLTIVDDTASSISSIQSHQGYYYLGSPFSSYLARVKIDQ